MYRTIIELKEETPKEIAKEIRQICIKAHDNFVGKVQIKDLSTKSFVFEGEEEDYACLNIGFLTLKEETMFRENVKTWQWEDEEPDESCDLLEIVSKPAYS